MRGQPQLAGRKQDYPPAPGRPCGSGTPGSSLAGAVGQGVDHGANLTRVGLAYLVQRKQCVIALGGDPL
ncbi:hypothetical protein D3C75_726610 [compost metagenome]